MPGSFLNPIPIGYNTYLLEDLKDLKNYIDALSLFYFLSLSHTHIHTHTHTHTLTTWKSKLFFQVFQLIVRPCKCKLFRIISFT